MGENSLHSLKIAVQYRKYYNKVHYHFVVKMFSGAFPHLKKTVLIVCKSLSELIIHLKIGFFLT